MSPRVVFEPEQGVLRLDPEVLESLDLGPRVLRTRKRAVYDALREAGVIRDQGFHPVVEPAMSALAEHLVRVRVTVTAHEREATAHGWVAPGAAVFAAPVPDDLDGPPQVVVGPPTGVASQVARIVDLGDRPCPAVDVAARLPHVAVEALLGAPRANARALVERLLGMVDAPEGLADALGGLAEGFRYRWVAQASWPVAEDRVERLAYHVLDGGSGGLWLHEPVEPADPDSTVTLTPMTPRGVWELLTTLLPTDADLLSGFTNPPR